ncbi:hypothetical protein V7O66_13710 [Methanolobus sp. ZRKC3]|uniref:hypothetical protein n=1 Tax=Methanolobus sp. ZRKC3 TaxID=3125786 RepID=UPI003249256D
MATIYPNIIYHADTETEIFIDTLQSIGNPRNADVVEYTSAVDGKPKSFTRSPGQRALMLNGKISTENENTLRRQLDYLIGEQVYIMLGAENLATLAKIRSYNFSKAVGTYTPLTLDVVCDGSSEGTHWKGTDYYSASSSTPIDDADATGGRCMRLYNTGSSVKQRIAHSAWQLPEGNYTLYARVKDQFQVTDDIKLLVRNYTDGADIASATFTAEADDYFNPIYKIVVLDFTIDGSDVGDRMDISVIKNTSNSNDVYLDYMGFVRRD